MRTASVIVNNYNYARFLKTAIDSALDQTHAATEVIVVDDGSTDESRDVIAGYGDRVLAVLKENGGQASAFNAGFAVSRGEVVIFLDADDALFPTAVEQCVEVLGDASVAKVHWNARVADHEGTLQRGHVRPSLSHGDLRETVLRAGPDGYGWPPTSSNAWARRFLERVFPIPLSVGHRPDLYLATLAPLYGVVKTLEEPQGFWRHHPGNHSAARAFEQNLREGLACAECTLRVLEDHGRALGFAVDPDELRHNSRWHQMQAAVTRIEAIVPPDEAFILVDQDEWATDETVAGRRRFLFVEEDGKWWGCPPDDTTAIRELERLRAASAGFLVVVWPYLWWLDHYAGFNTYLRSNYRPILANDRLVVFDLRLRQRDADVSVTGAP